MMKIVSKQMSSAYSSFDQSTLSHHLKSADNKYSVIIDFSYHEF
jgi:hypothetical protein